MLLAMTNTQLPYAQKFAELAPWYDQIFTSVKKDLRDEHLKIDKGFFKRNFPGRVVNKLQVEDLIAVYPKFIAAGSEKLGEFIANRWLLRHLEIYNFFEETLKKSYDDLEQIQEIDEAIAKALMCDAITRYGAVDCYIFSVLNAVAFSPSMLNELKTHATESLATA